MLTCVLHGAFLHGGVLRVSCRCVLRQRTLASVADALLLYAACQASAVVGLQLLQPVGSLKAGAVGMRFAQTLQLLGCPVGT